ncbi:hypothetical protein EYE40_09730 [Glaciihabitans arcticus]|uniref:Thioredoxin-like fold domain-containing protein n=1 Tax=Glaciihabitans arcticus TaxID=2668039 RepID=A0A4Q9GXZ4_9MICO|nr:thioredoxin domain-containing protein [Glaciihabitans arcticus]TBN57643.1 hypothetical protein EYE40_09730 [Glaciihabitans arcticus]
MTYGIPGRDSLSKNERREAAREKAKALRDSQRKKDKRTRLFIQGGVLIALVAVVAAVAIVLMVTINKPASPGPRNMLSDGILIGEDFVAKPTAGLQPGQTPEPNERDETSEVISIQLYIDYFCPVCGAFEKANGEQISAWVESGAATVEIFPYAITDSVSQGTKYATRSANAAACVADESPDQYFAFHQVLYDDRPDEGTPGLTDEQLIKLTKDAGVKNEKKVASCIQGQTFSSWVADARTRHRNGPIPGANIDFIEGTPTAIVNGVKYTGPLNDAEAFSAFVLQMANTSFNENSTSTPTPTPTPTVKE